MLDVVILPVGQMAANCYIVGSIIIDPGDDAEYIMSHLPQKPERIILTHGHFDHVMAAFAIQKTYAIPVYLHQKDEFLIQRMGESVRRFLHISTDPPPEITPITEHSYGGLTILHTPGHTPGSICLVGNGVIFTGDTIFAGGGVGRTDHVYSSAPNLTRSLSMILSYPQNYEILSGHGGKTTVGQEKRFHGV